jgi:ribose 1,5-bisphosphokinase PhnN
LVDEVAVVGQFSDQRVDLAQLQWRARLVFEVVPYETVRGRPHFERGLACVLDGRRAMLPDQRAHSQDALHASLAVGAVDLLAKRADVLARAAGASE